MQGVMYTCSTMRIFAAGLKLFGRGFSFPTHCLYFVMSTCISVMSIYTSGSGLWPVEGDKLSNGGRGEVQGYDRQKHGMKQEEKYEIIKTRSP